MSFPVLPAVAGNVSRNPEKLGDSVRAAECGLLSALCLNLDVHVDQRHGRRGNAGNSNRMSQCAWTNASELLVHLARQTADLRVIEPFRNDTLFGFLQAFDGALLLLKVAGIFDFSLNRP